MVGVKELMFEHCVFRLLHFGPAQSTHLWGMCVKSFEHHPENALWLTISPLGSTNQSSREISSKVHSGPVLWC